MIENVWFLNFNRYDLQDEVFIGSMLDGDGIYLYGYDSTTAAKWWQQAW